MKYGSSLLVVTDMERSKRFYHDVLGCEVIQDFGANVTLSGGFCLQTLETWKTFIHTDDVFFGANAGELYFETDDMDAFLVQLASMPDIVYVHRLKEHDWGQRAIRFYDPDRHIIEVGEAIAVTVQRFLHSGLTIAETAVRMDVPEPFVRACLAESAANL